MDVSVVVLDVQIRHFLQGFVLSDLECEYFLDRLRSVALSRRELLRSGLLRLVDLFVSDLSLLLVSGSSVVSDERLAFIHVQAARKFNDLPHLPGILHFEVDDGVKLSVRDSVLLGIAAEPGIGTDDLYLKVDQGRGERSRRSFAGLLREFRRRGWLISDGDGKRWLISDGGLQVLDESGVEYVKADIPDELLASFAANQSKGESMLLQTLEALRDGAKTRRDLWELYGGVSLGGWGSRLGRYKKRGLVVNDRFLWRLTDEGRRYLEQHS